MNSDKSPFRWAGAWILFSIGHCASHVMLIPGLARFYRIYSKLMSWSSDAQGFIRLRTLGEREIMPGNPRPIHPRVLDAREYESALRKSFLDPMFRRPQSKLAVAESANQAYRAMDEVVEEQLAMPRSGVSTDEIQSNLNRMSGYHRVRVISSFSGCFGRECRGGSE